MAYLLFDIGGTKMRIAFSRDLKRIDNLKVIATPKKFEDGMAVFKKNAEEILNGAKVKMICGGIAGPIDKDKNRLVNSPNISGWINKPLRKNMESAFGVPVFLENDADLAGVGEAVFGSGAGKNIVVYLTVSTGIGGTRVVDGKIDESSMGFEPGHQLVLCPFASGKITTIENCISGAAFRKYYKKNPYEISEKNVWDSAAEVLAQGLNNTIVHWSPDIVVIGGSMMKKVGISVPRVKFYLKNILKIFPNLPLIKKAKLGDIGGLYGAMALLEKKDG